jgi:hypothetical protein
MGRSLERIPQKWTQFCDKSALHIGIAGTIHRSIEVA